jgi:phosphoribosylglycinamide formyltransferase-1
LKKIAIFGSGDGTNAQNIIDYFDGSKDIKVSLIVSNNKDAKILDRAKIHKIKSVIIDKNFKVNLSVDYIILAGFLWKIPENIIDRFPNKIINIHPSLLPKFGGKGMYGSNVHKSVIESGETESGITIHYINNEYDKGTFIKKYKCSVYLVDTIESLAEKIHELEKNYPMVIEDVILNHNHPLR